MYKRVSDVSTDNNILAHKIAKRKEKAIKTRL
jgi:hypothetical protein